MTAIDENIKNLSRAVLSDQSSTAEQTLAQAKEKAQEIRANAQRQAEAERAKILDGARVEAERVRGQAVAITQLKARTLELEEREKLIEQVFEGARQKLADTASENGYAEISLRLLREALAQLGAPAARVHADHATARILTTSALDKIAAELQIKIEPGEAIAKGTGVIVETLDGRRQYDNTLETRLRRLQDTLRSPVYHILMGDKQ